MAFEIKLKMFLKAESSVIRRKSKYLKKVSLNVVIFTERGRCYDNQVMLNPPRLFLVHGLVMVLGK